MKKLLLSLVALLGVAGLANAASQAGRVPFQQSQYAAMAAGITGAENLNTLSHMKGGEEYLFSLGYEWGYGDVVRPELRQEVVQQLPKWMTNASFAFGYKRGQEDAQKKRK